MAADTPPQALVLPWNVVVSVGDLEALRAGAPEAGVTVVSRADLRRAERHLLASLVKETEGFMSRHFERKISLAVSRRLAGTSVSPNAMTLISLGSASSAPLFFLRPTPASETTGALLFLLHSILDGCDGELARLKFQESRWGGCSTSGATTSCTPRSSRPWRWAGAAASASPGLWSSGPRGRGHIRVGIFRVPAHDDPPARGPALHLRGDRGRNAALPSRRRGLAPRLHLSRSDTVRPRQGPLVPRARGRRRPGLLSHADGDRLRGTACDAPGGTRPRA